MTRPWDRIEDLFQPLPEPTNTPSPQPSPLDGALGEVGFDAVYAAVQQMADDAQRRLEENR